MSEPETFEDVVAEIEQMDVCGDYGRALEGLADRLRSAVACEPDDLDRMLAEEMTDPGFAARFMWAGERARQDTPSVELALVYLSILMEESRPFAVDLTQSPFGAAIQYLLDNTLVPDLGPCQNVPTRYTVPQMGACPANLAVRCRGCTGVVKRMLDNRRCTCGAEEKAHEFGALPEGCFGYHPDPEDGPVWPDPRPDLSGFDGVVTTRLVREAQQKPAPVDRGVPVVWACPDCGMWSDGSHSHHRDEWCSHPCHRPNPRGPHDSEPF